ncbi:RsmB/NOP family class I SAM-dependent RNA methyltransferase [Piscinibacter gummiphilus]|uniref:SAM-dependent methyltransferase n=1 Tax=Piscinibacter gummiphilus TaxID=946333 RepID=A0A1W6LE40_9BURK|nr:RsmB/NOP family class I SAM-dependent RNA methyltransferase [Piscinibacter gummiphilus]ARN22448.1 SAM-dependent methyltransferase [Piscinibacter gummiphilus]ATU67143.1 SAM-dependent methyltransferase [Piscinibacter gummiphilus]GLS98030.1 NOL1/NOP2/Sun family protein [Piscinibacter gummiphilus]
MHPNALLELSTDLLHQVLQFQAPADRVVSDFFRTHRELGSRERHTLAETTYGVLRQRLLFQHLAQSGKGEMERRLALLGWQGNDGFLKAAMSEQEQQWLEKVRQVDTAALPERLRHNLPDWLAEPLQAALGEEFWPLVDALNSSAPLDLRVNTFKAKREDVQAALKAGGIESEATPHSPWGLRVQGKPALNKADTFTKGEVEVQDEGSQLLALLTDAKRGEMVVDFCAGAGGKTLALGASMRNTGRLYAFDTSGHRLAALKPRLARSGLSNVYPIQIAHERDDRIKRLAGKIDRVLVDAPCSGLGTLRRNPDMKWRQSPQSVAELQAKQEAILASAARLLKPGGRLVYATCSLLDSENEGIADAFTAAHARDFTPVPAVEALEKAHAGGAGDLVRGPYLRLWPHRHGTDAFFAAVWERR